MIRAEITVRVSCDTVDEAKAAQATLEQAGFRIGTLSLDPKTFTATYHQELAKL